MPTSLLLLLAIACTRNTPEDSATAPPAPDLTERLGSGEVRAGVVTDDAALFGGISAEGRPGDLLLYNDRARFVVQGLRPASFYMEAAGQLIDADIVREPGEPGADAVEDWAGMAGLGRLLAGERITVREDGSDGVARVDVEGVEMTMGFLNGVVEGELIRPLGLEMSQSFVLRPDTPLLEVRTTFTSEDDLRVQPIDLLLGAQEVMETWYPTTGLGSPPDGPRAFTAYLSTNNRLTYATFPAPGTHHVDTGLDLIAEYASGVIAPQEHVDLSPDQPWTWVRYYGAGRDLAELTDAWQALAGAEVDTVQGVVEAADGPVAGARVQIWVEDRPFTVAVTGADGSWQADVPRGTEVRWQADGRGPSKRVHRPEGAGYYSGYASDTARALTLASLQDGAPGLTAPVARGVASPEDPLTLGVPAKLEVTDADGLPLALRLTPVDPPAAPDPSFARPLETQRLWTRQATTTFEVEPGTWQVLAHRGIRWEVLQTELTLTAGETTTLEVDLEQAYETPGYLLGDPHIHASPSQDGEVSMEDRLVVTAAHGLQLHFGTDHDHVVDYNPVIEALGLGSQIATVVSSEVSPVLRGHLNLYPLVARPDLPNGGAWNWWREPPEDTEGQMADLRAWYETPYISQSNHTLSGLASFADWEPGKIGDPDKWSTDIQAMEVNNAGRTSTLAVFEDLVGRGWRVAPTGVSDSHSHDSGGFGLNATFIGMGDVPADYSDEALIEAFEALDTIPTRGPFLDSSVRPGSTAPTGTQWTVTARSPSWIVVDQLELWRDGSLVETVEGTTATFTLSPDADAWYTVQARGNTDMSPVFGGRTPWAMTAPVFVDLDDDGWSPPLPPLTLAE